MSNKHFSFMSVGRPGSIRHTHAITTTWLKIIKFLFSIYPRVGGEQPPCRAHEMKQRRKTAKWSKRKYYACMAWEININLFFISLPRKLFVSCHTDTHTHTERDEIRFYLYIYINVVAGGWEWLNLNGVVCVCALPHYVQEVALVLLLNSLLKKQFDTQHKMKHVCECVGKISIICR